ncbi:hypothetical protein PUN28_008224 [Cardiocondyla obscurior]|uniref:Secreted protein n=1 Tax=Cardiocondyla obscurior TaxID=286306 RepID=A0AAW2FWP5_9HYME
MLVKTLFFYIAITLEAFIFCFAGEYVSNKLSLFWSIIADKKLFTLSQNVTKNYFVPHETEFKKPLHGFMLRRVWQYKLEQQTQRENANQETARYLCSTGASRKTPLLLYRR